MAEMGTMVRQMEIKSSGDLYFQLNHKAPHTLTKISPTKILNYELIEGEPGTIGCVTKWIYDNDGMIVTGMQIITAIDEKNKVIKYKVLDGEIMQMFKSFEYTLEVNTIGKKDLVKVSLEFQKISENVEDPVSTMKFFMDVVKDIDTYHLNNLTKS